MNLEQILPEYDAMFGKNSLQEIEEYLVKNILEAKEHAEVGIVITLLNEIIGFYRDTTQKEKALHYCEQLQKILKEMKMEGRIDYATSLLNVANAYRAFGLFEESLNLYRIVEATYEGKVLPTDFMYASLYNNWSLLYQEMEEYESAKDMLKKALVIVQTYEEAVIEQATTKVNLASTLLQIGTQEAFKEAQGYLEEALEVFEKDGGRDFHYGAALVAMGDAFCFQKEYEKAIPYYEKGLQEIEKHVGKTDNYVRVMEKYEHAKSRTDISVNTETVQKTDDWISNLERCREFYEMYGKEMIHTKFPEYENRIAVGLVGEGSDCFCFDDYISMDHDYEVGFCMWLLQEDYAKIAAALQDEYEKLVLKYTKQTSKDLFLQRRRGVFAVNEFFNQLLGFSYDYEKLARMERETIPGLLWEQVTEHALSTVVNGEVFTDKTGIFSAIRQKFRTYYPEELWRRKLAQGLHDFSQYAQSNYPRMMARKDETTALICVAKAMETTMDLVYLLRHEYAPYYKWKKKGLERMTLRRDALFAVQEILQLLDGLACTESQIKAWERVKYCASVVNRQDEKVVAFEKIAFCLLQEMKRQGLVKGEDTFLEGYIYQLLRGEHTEQKEKDEKTMNNINIIEEIVKLEWEQFDKVQNEGGRAGCQDDYETFSIMRKSQYLTWPEELLNSFYQDLVEAQNKGWNLIMEKYARMMQSTTPDRYMEFADELPDLSKERVAIQEEIIKIQVGWMEEFAQNYPKMAGNARTIRTSEDTPFQTSYETYLRGEMGTYSEETFILYGRFITGLAKENRNLAYEIMENTAKMYGYESVETAEMSLK